MFIDISSREQQLNSIIKVRFKYYILPLAFIAIFTCTVTLIIHSSEYGFVIFVMLMHRRCAILLGHVIVYTNMLPGKHQRNHDGSSQKNLNQKGFERIYISQMDSGHYQKTSP
ncbi:hypothetical protein BDA99DRAFT_538204 [Phascolomyces articulosus]|uniref:Uncharacterized protein n=1 Tax=Phascolomyces articulosus TaxID=60185 RepID=A0AAD5PER1_9FUNG|nr:hypothetical protein BDA99DRAFT_538204 [Phascolomyces articulosus]